MSEENRKLETWEYVIVDFFEHRVEKSKLCKARKYIEEKEKYIKSEKDVEKLEKLKKNREKKQEELKKLREDAPSTEIRQWIDETSKKNIAEGKRIIKATHVLKFSHGSSEAEGFLLTEKSNDTRLTTASIKGTFTYDIAHNNGNLVTISRFLALKLSGNLIIDLILDDNFQFLAPFVESKIQFNEWKDCFKNLVEQREIKTADKAKQIYFPLTTDNDEAISGDKYHLISPLFSSSLAEKIYSVGTELKFSEEQKEIREKRKENNNSTNKSPKYHPNHYIEFPNLGIQKFGGAQPQNISMLNKNRNGQCFIFSTQPPTWQGQLKTPIYKKSLFDVSFGHQNTKANIDYLREFLLRFERIDLSIQDPERRKWVNNWVDNIIDELLFYAASIQSLPSGWSNANGIKLKKEHQFFLDPYRQDEVFQTARKASDWQTVVCDDFARWLNRKLSGKDKKFTPQREHRRMWIQLLEQPFREYNQTIDADIKFQSRAKV